MQDWGQTQTTIENCHLLFTALVLQGIQGIAAAPNRLCMAGSGYTDLGPIGGFFHFFFH